MQLIDTGAPEYWWMLTRQPVRDNFNFAPSRARPNLSKLQRAVKPESRLTRHHLPDLTCRCQTGSIPHCIHISAYYGIRVGRSRRHNSEFHLLWWTDELIIWLSATTLDLKSETELWHRSPPKRDTCSEIAQRNSKYIFLGTRCVMYFIAYSVKEYLVIPLLIKSVPTRGTYIHFFYIRMCEVKVFI